MTGILGGYRIRQAVTDAIFVAAAWYLAFWLRFDGGVPDRYDVFLGWWFLAVLAIKVAVFVAASLYNHWWRYVSIRDIWSAARAVAIASLIAMVFIYLADPVEGSRLPRSVFVLDFLILLALVTGSRVLTRSLLERPGRRGLVARGKEALVVGAGSAGQLIVREMRVKNLGYTPVGFVDDDSRKQRMRIDGVRVLGTTLDLPAILGASEPDEVIIALPSAAGEKRQEIVNVCRDAGVAVKTLPAVHELLAGELELGRLLREVQVEDVLGREAVDLDLASIASYIEGETVLVTGAGGSIGSELCRQLAGLGAGVLVLVDHGEGALVDIERELQQEREFRAAVSVLADVKDRAKMQSVLGRYEPSVVFHAAAYKHVPLTEANPVESVRNNVLATKVLAEVASECAVGRFVLVSTDKAVNPKNILGQTKALCEWVVAAAAQREQNGTDFIAVRFGNVLGSSGSVIPLFKKQIARGGPVTVTHPEMTRYFMTIPEAVQLVIQAGAIGKTGDVYVLDVGTPVSVLEVARSMIRLSGKEPDSEIAIEFIGVRPGEKLHEELWAGDERPVPTSHSEILRCESRSIDPEWLEEEIAKLERLVEADDVLGVVAKLGELTRDPRRAPTGAIETV